MVFLFLVTILFVPTITKAQSTTVFATASATASTTATTTPRKPFIVLDPILNLQIKFPGLDKLASDTPATCTTEGDKTSCSLPWIAIYIKAIYNYAIGVIGILAALALMIGGVIYLTSLGNATRISEAKSWITGALTGMLIMFTSYILLNEINPNLVGLKPIELSIVNEEPVPMVPIEELVINGVPLTASGSCTNGIKAIAAHKNVTTNGKQLCGETADKLEAVFDCMDRKWPNKYLIVVNDGIRTYAQQLAIFNGKANCKPYFISDGKCTPGYDYTYGCNASCPNSKAKGSHFSGAAVDIQAFEKDWTGSALSQLRLQDCMGENGFVILIAATKSYNELWHFENPVCSSGTKYNYTTKKIRNHLLGSCRSCSARRADFKKQYNAGNADYRKYKAVYDRKDYDYDSPGWKNPFF